MRKRLVIVADDHVDSAEMLAVLLRIKLGVCVRVVHNGRAAVQLALAERPSAVILDIDMPILNGVQAAEAIRRDAQHPLPMLISVSGNVELVSRCSVFDQALSKPLDLRRLVEILA